MIALKIRVVASEDPRQILMHPALVPDFEKWLAARGLELHCVGKFSEDDLPSWVVSPTDEKLREIEREESGKVVVRDSSGKVVGRQG